jgi:aspartyl-tRNA(Asn)/glutamyl-tRNA(Gln) amidotransferase subunit C
MAISEDEVLYVAKLARLSLSPDEVKTYAGQLGQILEFINKLNEVDVTGVEPTASITGTSNVLRPDEVRKDFDTAEMMKNAPEKDGDHFVVPQVIE